MLTFISVHSIVLFANLKSINGLSILYVINVMSKTYSKADRNNIIAIYGFKINLTRYKIWYNNIDNIEDKMIYKILLAIYKL